ncbi:hypothetical protein ABC304_16050 [Microbacterium sp. 1P10UB]|nr:hypothetical protein [Microbacterium lemovicicum]
MASIWIRLMRVIAKMVPSKKMASGKNSSIEGGWKPLSSDSAAMAIRLAT